MTIKVARVMVKTWMKRKKRKTMKMMTRRSSRLLRQKIRKLLWPFLHVSARTRSRLQESSGPNR